MPKYREVSLRAHKKIQKFRILLVVAVVRRIQSKQKYIVLSKNQKAVEAKIVTHNIRERGGVRLTGQPKDL